MADYNPIHNFKPIQYDAPRENNPKAVLNPNLPVLKIVQPSELASGTCETEPGTGLLVAKNPRRGLMIYRPAEHPNPAVTEPEPLTPEPENQHQTDKPDLASMITELQLQISALQAESSDLREKLAEMRQEISEISKDIPRRKEL